MKKIYNKYKSWRKEARRIMGQKYANFVIKQLKNSTSDWELNYWMNQGQMLDLRMVEEGIYLD